MKRDTGHENQRRATPAGSLEILNTIVETMPGAVYVAEWIEGAGLQYSNLYESPSIEQFTGIGPGELTTHPGKLLSLVHPDDKRNMVDAFYRAVHAPEEVEVQYRLRNQRTGELRWIHERIRSIESGASQNRRFIIGVMMDVTELRETEAELERAKDRMQVLVEGTPYLFFYIQDTDGNVTYVSPSVEGITGYSVEEWLGQRHWFTTENRINDLARTATHAHLRGETDTPAFEFEIRHKNGGTVILEAYEHPYLIDGVVMGIQGVARDVTEERRLEAALLEARKLETVGRLASGLAHDFNNMLQGIITCADLIGARSGEDSVRELASEIVEISERGAKLVQQLLAYSRQQVYEPIPIDLNSLIRNMVTFLQRVIGDDIRISLDLSTDLPRILGDRGQLEQVLLNMASNARHAMPDGGTFAMRTRFMTSQGRDDEQAEVVLSIEDDGQGIAPELQDTIFEPYFTTHANEGGTGLGLASVKGIVEQHQGHISVQSTVGKGTVFRIGFPPFQEPFGVEAPQETVPAEDVTVPVSNPSGRILLVDDNDDVRRSLGDVLTFSGYQAVPVASVAQAVKALEEHEFDLVVTDLQLSDGSGLDVIGIVRQRMDPHFPAILMSGYPRGGLPGMSKELPVSVTFLEKPVRIKRLLETIEASLSSLP